LALLTVLTSLLLGLTGCAGHEPGLDAGPSGKDSGAPGDATVDAGGTDADPVDAGPVDAGPVDAGPVDAGRVDAGLGPIEGTCDRLPPVADYGAPGPFDVEMQRNTGPNGNYTLYRPGHTLGVNGFKHPLATWGNGILTTPDEYQVLLGLIASHGFVIIACNDVQAEQAGLSAGLDWLVAQNQAGPMAGKLDVTREVTIGYSWGGGAAIDTANRPNVKATVSLHGMPPRQATAFADMHSPLLLFTSTGDSFVTKDKYVTPNYDGSLVQTFYATLEDTSAGHLYVVDVDAFACLVSPLLGGCGSAKRELAPTVAWLRMLACDDRAARPFFYGPHCTLCGPPWSSEKKLWPQPDSAL